MTIAAGQLQPQRQIRRDSGWRAGAWALFDRGYSSLPALLAVRQFAAPGVGDFLQSIRPLRSHERRAVAADLRDRERNRVRAAEVAVSPSAARPGPSATKMREMPIR
jgi:hypothetical protein